MAIRKNPDWHVWATDLAYWVRQSPQVFIIIGVVLILGLFFILPRHQTTQPIFEQPYVPQYAPLPPPPEETFRRPPTCPPDYFWYTPEGACSLLKTANYTLYPGERISFSPAHLVKLEISDGSGFVHFDVDNTDHPFLAGKILQLRFGGYIQISEETIVNISLYPEP
jgi:hypothetical protein